MSSVPANNTEPCPSAPCQTHARTDQKLWPQHDLIRLVGLLQVSGLGALLAACKDFSQNLQAPASAVRQSGANPEDCDQILEAHRILAAMDDTLLQAEKLTAGQGELSIADLEDAERSVLEKINALEADLASVHCYCYSPDIDMAPGKLVARKGTWIKTSTRFSWELPEEDKFYVPQGMAVPIIQLGPVTDREEATRHDWAGQHLKIWMKPAVMKALEARRHTWFVYLPHFRDEGLSLLATSDSWIKRSAQLSGELDPFEMVYIPQGIRIQLAGPVQHVQEEWERDRHNNVYQHRKIVLARPLVTIKQDNFDIMVGHDDSGGSRENKGP